MKPFNGFLFEATFFSEYQRGNDVLIPVLLFLTFDTITTRETKSKVQKTTLLCVKKVNITAKTTSLQNKKKTQGHL